MSIVPDCLIVKPKQNKVMILTALGLPKLARVMRLTAFILLAGCLEVTAAGYSQTVTLSVKGEPLERVFREIQTQTGFTFVYYKEDLQKAKPVDLQVSDAPIEDALAACFRDQPFTYTIVDKYVVVKQKILIDNTQKEISPPGDIIGNVTDSSGVPMENVNITVKRTGYGTITDARGNFVLHNVEGNDVLVFSYVGFDNLSISVKGRSNIHLKMRPATSMLDEAVVQAYGHTSQRLATGNIGTVTAKEIETQPVMNPLLTLEGRVAGLVVSPASGYASSPVRVEIRGRNSINGTFTSDPLYVIDGVPLTVLDISPGGTIGAPQAHVSTGFIQNGLQGPAGGQSPFFSLNPSDIESVEILKDADATAIYGSRGANGVILVTTKKGKVGKTHFNLNVYQGMSEVTRHWDMLNTTQYLAMRREAFKNAGIIPTTANAPDLLVWDTTQNTDWQQYLWGGMGKNTDIQSSLLGGDSKTQFRISATYNHQVDILTASGANQRGALSFNLTHHSIDQRFGISFTTNYSYAQINAISIPGAVTLPPDAPPVYNSKGALNFLGWAPASNQFPFGPLLNPYTSNTNFLTTNLTLNLQICKGLNFTTSIGYNNSQVNQTQLTTIASQNPTINPKGSIRVGYNRNNNWIVEPQLNYNTFLGKGKLDILFGGTAQSALTDGINIPGSGYTNDALLRSIANAPISSTPSEFYGEYKYAAMFGRINYNWENKYILNLNGRRDGSSRFGPGKQFGNFGSIGAAWIISEENWLNKYLPAIISFIKLRGSYGITGSDAIGDYQYLSQWSPNGLPTYDGVSPLTSIHIPNPDFHWQVNRKSEGGIAVGLLHDRINLEAVYYQNRCNNQLTQIPIPDLTGFSSVTANWPADVQNSGWEFLINSKIVNHKFFTWSINFNIAFNKNILLAFPNIESTPYYSQYKVGQPLSTVYLLHYIGVDPQTGQYAFQDRNKDGKITYNTSIPPGTGNDDRYGYNISPKFTGGGGTSFTYKNWSLNAFFTGRKQLGQNAFAAVIAGSMANIPTVVYNNSWHNVGDKSIYSGFTVKSTTSNNNFLTFSDGTYSDASFIRLQNLSLSYSLPERLAKKAGMQNCSLYMNAQNVFVITSYKGIDPEAQNFGLLPPAKIYVFGISIGF